MNEPAIPNPGGIGPRRLHPVWMLNALVSGVRNSIGLFFGVGLTLRSQSGFVLALGLAALLLAILGYRILQWMRISYQASDGAITLRSGILGQTERVVPIERIQNVNTVATPVDRLFGTLQLAIETAGTGERLTLETLSQAQAASLQQWIEIERGGSAVAGSGTAASPDSGGTVLHVMTGRDLLVAGLTSGRVGPAIALIAAAFRFGSDFLPERYWNRLPFDPGQVTVAGVATVLALAALIAWTLSLLSAVITYWRFTLRRTDDDLTITAGLLDRRQVTIPLARMQAVSVVEGPLRQPFGYAAVMIENASRYAGELEGAGSQTLVPLIKRSAIPALLDAAAPQFRPAPEHSLQPLPRRALRRYLLASIRRAVPIVAAALVLFWLLPGQPWWYALGLLPIVPILAFSGYLEFRDAGWAIDAEERLIIRRRSIDRITTITPRRRVQTRTLSQSLFQRRADLASLRVRLAGGSARSSMTLVHLDQSTALSVVDRLGPSRDTDPDPPALNANV